MNKRAWPQKIFALCAKLAPVRIWAGSAPAEEQLAKIEKECGIPKRWDWSSNSAKAIALEIIENERVELIES